MATTLLSPRRYLRGGYGLALPTDFTYSQLRSVLIRAQEQVGRYCNVPKLPQAFDWRGGTMTDEQHQWKLSNPLAYGPGVKRVYLNAAPLKTVSAFHIDLGKTYRVDFDPATALYLNLIENYLEIVAISPTVVGVWPLGVALGLYNPVSRTTYQYGWSFEVTGDLLEAESPTVYSASYGNWVELVDPVIMVAGVEIDPLDYTLDLNDGVVTFTNPAAAPRPGQQVTADYLYSAPSDIVDAIGFAATAMLTQARINARGMAGLSSLKVAEVSMTLLAQNQATRNGATISAEAANLADSYVFGTAAA